MEEVNTERTRKPVAVPRSIIQAKVDEKGRLKFPAKVKDYLQSIDDEFFMTSVLNDGIVRLYTNEQWAANEKVLLDANNSDSDDILFRAKDRGGDVTLDGQGRALLPAQLRNHIDLTNKPVWVECSRDKVLIYGREVYEKKQARSDQEVEEKVDRMRGAGLRI